MGKFNAQFLLQLTTLLITDNTKLRHINTVSEPMDPVLDMPKAKASLSVSCVIATTAETRLKGRGSATRTGCSRQHFSAPDRRCS
ncbi:MAG: hypothetical protein IPJ33_00770 [Gammaproteobacteria bacterium]|nr:hypothetical protein [Gammaproteobacteria bacterium]